MSIPRYKRVAIDWDLLYSSIISQGHTIASISKRIGLSESSIRSSKYDEKMNPAVVAEIGKYVDLDMNAIIKDKTVERPNRARNTSGRIGTDWLFLEKCAKEHGYTLSKLSLMLGKAGGFLYACKREGGISEDLLIKLGDILNIDYHTLIKVTSYDRWTLRHEVVDMVRNQTLPDFTKEMRGTIEEIYHGASPLWQRLKEVMIGEVSNYYIRDNEIINESDYDLAEKYKPDINNFSINDVAQCTSINDLPTDWRYLAFACMKKYRLPPFSKDIVK